MSFSKHGEVKANWHSDSVGSSKPHELVGRSYVHMKTSHLYVVTGYRFNATTDKWHIEYERADEGQRLDFGFGRDMDEFLDGRFMEVK